MKLPVLGRRSVLICAVSLLAGPSVSSSEAGMYPGGYGYTAGYAPGYTHTAAYGGGFGCCLLNLFHGCGLFGHHQTYYAGYAPTYSYPSAPCSPCAPCNPCAPACDPCGGASTYSLSGLCCPSGGCPGGNCGYGICSGGDCGVGSGTVPYSGDPVPQMGDPMTPSTPSQTPNRTYREEDGDGFQPPRGIEGTDRGGASPGTSGGGLITPPEDPPQSPDSDFERGDDIFNYKIPARESQEEDESEPQVVQPLDIETSVAFEIEPELRRAHYRAVFRAPSVTRTRLPAQQDWEPVPSETKLVRNR